VHSASKVRVLWVKRPCTHEAEHALHNFNSTPVTAAGHPRWRGRRRWL